MEIQIFGCGSDCIVVDRYVREEFYIEEDSTAYLAFSDGTLLRIGLMESIWKIFPMAYGEARYSKNEEIEDGSEKVTLEGKINWVVCGNSWLSL